MNIIISGGHSGIGFELTKQVLGAGHKVGLIVRSESRKKEAIGSFEQGENIDFFIADLSKRAEVARVAKEIEGKWEVVDGLFNNAGVLTATEKQSPQGVELQFEVNAVAPYNLSKELIPALAKAKNPFIINTATRSLHKQKSLDIEDLKHPKKFVKLTGSYLDSKFALVLMMNHLSQEYPEVRIISVDPGGNKTNMTSSEAVPFFIKPMVSLLFSHPSKGAKKLFDAAFSGDFSKSGSYIANGKEKGIKISLSDTEMKELLSTA